MTRKVMGRRRGGWSPLVVSATVAAALCMATLDGAKSVPFNPGARGSHVQLTGGTSGPLPTYMPSELWDGGNPVENCSYCDASNLVSSPAGGESTKGTDDVNPETGDFSTSNTLFNIPAIGGPLEFTIDYDSEQAWAQAYSSAPAGYFGYGWSSTMSSSMTYLGGIFTVTQQNGSQVQFEPPQTSGGSASDGCPVGDYQAVQKYTVPGSADPFCAPSRVDAQAGVMSTYNTYQFDSHGGRQVTTYDMYGQLYSIGNLNNVNFVTVRNVTPGSANCPSSGESSCFVETDGAGRVIVAQVDSLGLVQEVSDPLGREYSLTYDADGDLQTVNFLGGSSSYTWTYGYTNAINPAPYNHEMNAVENPDSNTKHIHYNSATGAFKGMVSSEVDYLGSNTTSYTYSNGHCSDSTGCVNSTQTTNVTYADGEVDQDTYSSSILLEDTYGPSYTGPGVVSWNYDWTFPTAQNQPTTDVINYPDGATATAVEDAAGQITSFTNAAGNYVNSMYNDTGGNDLDELCWSALQGVAVSASNSCDSPPAGATTYTYDSTGHELSQTDPMGNMTRHGYYANGLLCWTAEPTVTGPGGPCAGSTPSGAAPGGATAYEYDSYGDQTATIVDYGASSPPETTSNYDTNGELLYVIPPDGQGSGGFGSNPYETAYSYYENGLTESVTAPLSRTTSYTYDAAGNELTETDPAGVTTNTYTADNQVCWTLRSTAASGNACGTAPTGSTHYGGYLADTDAPTDIVDPNGNTSTIAYADEAYPTSPTLNDDVSNSGAEESFTAYDSLGNACLTGPGDPYTGGTPPCQATSGDTYKQYNDVGQLQSTTDPSSVVTSYSYADGAYPLEPTTVTYGSGSSEEITDIGYDPAGRQLYTYDSEGNYVTTADDSDGRVCWSGPSGEGYTWLADNFISPANNLCSDVPSGTGISTFGYNADDQRSSMVDNYGTAQQTSPPDAYTYDADGNLTSASDDNGRTVSYQYDDAAEMTCMAYPVLASPNCQNSPSSTNSVVDYGYNGAGQMTSSQDWLGNTVTDTGYNALSELGKITYPTTASAGSEKVSYTYGNAGNLTKTAYAGPVLNGDDDTYTPNPDEQLASMTGLDSFTSASDTYDSYQRASKATNPATGSGNAAVNTFQYNSDGTISQDLPQSHSAITFAYNGSDQLTSITNPNTTAPYNKPATSKYAYTGDGQRCWSAPGTTTGTCTTAPTGATSYGWNNLGQMCWSGATTSSTSACSSPPSGTTTYTYDGDGLRMTETPSSGAALSFTWDTDASVPLVVDDGTNAYIYGPTLFGGTAPVEQIKISTKAVTWLASTPSGVQTAFLEVGGTEKEQAAYTTYGTLVLQASTSNVSPFGFQGSYTDKSGLIYLVNRYYDPLTDQFISADPMMAKTGQPYAFTADDPLNGSDPVGLFRAGVGGQQCGGGPDPTCNTGNQGGPVTVPQGAPGGEGPSGGSPSPAVGSTPYGGVSVTRAGPTEVIPVGAAARVTVTSSLTISGRNSNPHVSVETDGTLDISEGDSSAQISPDGAIEGVGQGIGGQGVYLCATAGGGGICYQAPPISYDLGTGAHISATITAEYGPNPSPGTRQTLEAAGVVVTVAGIAAVVVGCGLFDTVTGSGLCPIPGTQ